ncbi:hypothetical protein BDN70DRAFT_358099 [Pholiota conissans]|uniref:Uncharacterized protein n=1 Tax=Pholiota conissans TaxID=109636 RepID=A0A9P5ZA89_9AGAR|nr:hypothetical protein BDN70DRAFT_358099 [Pholiota conissans]
MAEMTPCKIDELRRRMQFKFHRESPNSNFFTRLGAERLARHCCPLFPPFDFPQWWLSGVYLSGCHSDVAFVCEIACILSLLKYRSLSPTCVGMDLGNKSLKHVLVVEDSLQLGPSIGGFCRLYHLPSHRQIIYRSSSR